MGKFLGEEDPVTWGVFNYKDNQDWTTESSWKRSKKWQLGQEYDPSNENLEKFQELYDKDALLSALEEMLRQLMLVRAALRCLGKTLAKEKPKVLEKAKAKAKANWQSKTKRMKMPMKMRMAAKNLQKKTRSRKPKKKGRKGRDELANAKANVEEALEKAKGSLNNKGRANAEGWKVELGKLRKKVQDTLHKERQCKQCSLAKGSDRCSQIAQEC